MDVIPLCREPVELAQLASELLAESLARHCPSDYEPKLLSADLASVFQTPIGADVFFDREDAYRIGDLERKHPFPASILHMMSEGHVEDFLGSWCADGDQPDAFNPDKEWRILFRVP